MKTSPLKRSVSQSRAAAEPHHHAILVGRQSRSGKALQARQSGFSAVSVTPADFQASGTQLMQRQQVARLQQSPGSLAQLQKVSSLQSATAQRAATRGLLQENSDTAQRVEDEEALQGKMEAVQRMEEEEPLQGKMKAVQRMEEEEPLQGKMEAVQRMEEEELLQGKMEAVQRMEEEELLQGKMEAVQRMEEEELLQGKMEAVQRTEEEELLQGKFATLQKQPLEEEEPLQGKAASAQREVDPAATAADAGGAEANKTGLPDNLKSGIETLSGMSLDSVKVHYNSDKPAQLNALAYAQGTDIHVASGQEQHLPHEAWHVVQQAQGRVKPTVQSATGEPVNDDPGLEKEADVMGAKAAQLARSSEPASNVGRS